MSASDREKEIVASTLANNFLFSSMQTEPLNEIASQMIRLENGEGYRLITQGESGDYFYVLVSGHADALRKETNEPKPIPADETEVQKASRLFGVSSAYTASLRCYSYMGH